MLFTNRDHARDDSRCSANHNSVRCARRNRSPNRRRWARRPSTISAVGGGIWFHPRLRRAKVAMLTRRLGPMSKFKFAAIAAIMAGSLLLSVDGSAFADASDTELASLDFVSAPADADFGRHSHDGWQHHVVALRLPHRKNVIVHHRLHPTTAVVVRRELKPVVVAGGALRRSSCKLRQAIPGARIWVVPALSFWVCTIESVSDARRCENAIDPRLLTLRPAKRVSLLHRRGIMLRRCALPLF